MTCKIVGCTKPAHTARLCITCYRAWLRDGVLPGPVKEWAAERVLHCRCGYHTEDRHAWRIHQTSAHRKEQTNV